MFETSLLQERGERTELQLDCSTLRLEERREGRDELDDNVDLDSLLSFLLEDVVKSVLLLSGSSQVEFGGKPATREETERVSSRVRPLVLSFEARIGAYHQS